MGHGWQLTSFWLATVYSVYNLIVPVNIQNRMLTYVHIDSTYRVGLWGFLLAEFFLYAGFQAWSENEQKIADDAKPKLQVIVINYFITDYPHGAQDWDHLVICSRVINRGAATAIYN